MHGRPSFTFRARRFSQPKFEKLSASREEAAPQRECQLKPTSWSNHIGESLGRTYFHCRLSWGPLQSGVVVFVDRESPRVNNSMNSSVFHLTSRRLLDFFYSCIKFSCKHDAISKGKGISARWGFSSTPGGWDCAIRLLNSWSQNFNVKVKHFFLMEEKEGFPFTRCLWKFKKQQWSRLSTRRVSLRSKLFLSPSLPPPLPGYCLSNTWKRLISIVFPGLLGQRIFGDVSEIFFSIRSPTILEPGTSQQ